MHSRGKKLPIPTYIFYAVGFVLMCKNANTMISEKTKLPLEYETNCPANASIFTYSKT